MKLLIGLGLLALPWRVSAAELPDARVLLVDQARIEQETTTLKRLTAESQTRTELKPQQIKESLELVLSEILTVLPEAVEAIARAQNADLVVQASAWPRDTEMPEDATAAVIAEIDRRLNKLTLVIP